MDKSFNLDNLNTLVFFFFFLLFDISLHRAITSDVHETLLSIVIPNTLWFCTSSMTSHLMVREGRIGINFCLSLSSGYKYDFSFIYM